MGKFMAVGLTDLLESAGMNGVPAFVGLGAAVGFSVHVYRQRLGHLVDSGADLRADVYAAGLPPGVCADPVSHRRFIGAAAGAGFTVCTAVSRLFYSATDPTPASGLTTRWCSLTR